MSVKEVVPRALARRDIEEAIDHYLEEAGGKAALGFIDEIERAFRHIACRPAAGSPRYVHELDLPEGLAGEALSVPRLLHGA